MVFSAGLEATALRQAGCLPLHQETVLGATPETATGTGALPGKVPSGGRAPAPANGSLRWTNRAKGG
jgi:hypothetical protein